MATSTPHKLSLAFRNIIIIARSSLEPPFAFASCNRVEERERGMGKNRRHVSWVTTFLAGAQLAAAVDLGTCKINIQARLDNNTLARNDSIFHFNGTTYMSQRDNIALTIAGCQAHCPKPYFDLYSDMWPR